MDMHQVVGLDLDFHMEIHYGDVDTEYEELELTLLSGPAWTHSLDGNHLFGMPTDLGHYPMALQLVMVMIQCRYLTPSCRALQTSHYICGGCA